MCLAGLEGEAYAVSAPRPDDDDEEEDEASDDSELDTDPSPSDEAADGDVLEPELDGVVGNMLTMSSTSTRLRSAKNFCLSTYSYQYLCN